MAGKTKHFGLGYFDFKDRLDTSVSVKLERDRFLTIDDQLFGLYSVFGNGIVRGFRVTRSQNESGIKTLSIEPGVLFCRNRSFESVETKSLENLPPNGEFYVFADIFSTSSGDKDLVLYYSRSGTDLNAIRLARIETFNGDVSKIDYSYRHEISFRRIIENEVAKHKHNGTVSKIDLLREVKNTLPGARVGSLDASKVQYGTFKRERIPQINHNNLKNKGIVSHAGLETLARSLQNVNRQLLGEISSVNMMKHSLMLKRKYPSDSDGSVNMITFIPGLVSNSAIDFSNSSVNINLNEGCISGRRTGGGRQVSIYYNNIEALESYSFINNCSITDAFVYLNSTVSSSTVQFTDSFENATGADRPYPGTTAQAVSVENKIAVRSDVYNVVSGLFSARFTSGKKDKSVYKREVTTQKNWTSFNRLFLSVKCSQSPHPPVFFYMVNANADNTITESEKIQLLAEDEVTSNAALSNFKSIEIDITDYTKNNITELVFEVADAATEFAFYVDDIKTSSVSTTDVTYVDSGSVRYRYLAPTQVILESISFETEELDNTSVQCRFRTGSSIVELLNATFSSPISSNDQITVPCNAVEVEFTLRTNPEKSASPKLNNLVLVLLIQGGERRIEVNALSEWQQGTRANIEIFSESGDADYGIRIRSPLETKHIIYSSNNYVQQIKNALPDVPPAESNISVFGFNGANLLQSPQQIMSSTAGNPAVGLDQASSVFRMDNRNYLICDTYNNRVLEINREGQLVRGYGGSYIIENGLQGDFIPLCANFNSDNRLLQIVFDKDIENRSDISIQYITLVIGQTQITLGDVDVNVNDNAPKNCIQVRLSLQKTQILKDTSTPIFVKLTPAVIKKEKFNSDSEIFSIAYGISGLRLTKQKFTYTKQVFHPISAIAYDDNNWIIANSLISFDRIRAGLREDIDEFFIPVNVEEEFFIIAEVPQDLGGDVRVTFLNDQTASSTNNETYEPVIILNGNNIAFDGTVEVVTQSNFSAKVKVKPNAPMLGLDFSFIFRVSVKVLDTITNTYVPVEGSPYRIEKRIHVINQATAEGSEQAPDMPSVIRMNILDGQVDFAFGKVDQFTFSDFTLGGLYKLEDGNILMGGIKKLPADLQFDTNPPNDDGFRAQAFNLLKSYRGQVIKINPDDSAVSFNYESPDGLYVSDCSMTSTNEILIAESSIIQNSGRTIKIDGFGNISFNLSNGQFSIINHARESGENSIIIST